MLRVSLEDRGWFDAGRRHLPLAIIPAPANWNDPLPMNTIAISVDDVEDEPAEMGSNYTDDTWTFYIDFYAENEALGTDVANDIRDILRGKLPSIGRDWAGFDVYDYTDATPFPVFQCEIENVLVDRARGTLRPWERYWFSIRCEVEDTYGDEFDGIGGY